VSGARRFDPAPLLDALHSVDVGEVRVAEAMGRHTTLHVGGPADVWVRPDRADRVERLLALCRRLEAPLLPLGRGSNLLVRDDGLPGVVMATDALTGFEMQGVRIRAWAGVTLGGLANRASRAGVTGFEWSAGIPGSVGGGVYMNAGAHGGSMEEHVEAVAFLALDDTTGVPAAMPSMLGREACGFAYRTSRFQTEPGVILWADLRGERGDPGESRERLRAYRDHRRTTQPLSWPNCGSVFRNPPGMSAGRLVEAAGGKGRREGNASISEVHGNFIVNLGGARADDVLRLIDWAQEAVWQRFGVRLETEVRILPA